MNFNDREKIIELTPLWKGERLPDGRPKVEDKYLDALYGMTLEEVWKPIFVLGYEHQFVGGGEHPFMRCTTMTESWSDVPLPAPTVPPDPIFTRFSLPAVPQTAGRVTIISG